MNLYLKIFQLKYFSAYFFCNFIIIFFIINTYYIIDYEKITVKPRNKKELHKIKIALKLVDANFEIDKIELNDFQKKAIDEALEDIANGRVFSHEEVMIERKKLYPNLFN